MSGIAGVLARNGETVDRDLVRRMGNALKKLGPDGEFIEVLPPVAMLCRPLYVNRADQRDAQPVLRSDGILLAWDGRLDNANDVESALGWPSGSSSTSELIVGAYRRWGTGAFAVLIGDFAVSIWDSGRRQLVLACDAIGVRSLSYQITDKQCIWATTAKAILLATGQSQQPDKEYLAAFIVNQPSSRSAFKGIDILSGGHALIVTPMATRVNRYWRIDPSHRIEHGTDEDYEAHFHHLFRKAIACRMWTASPVFSELSGGVDSTAIACVADQLHRDTPEQVAELKTVSYVFPRAKSSDETPFIRLVEAYRGSTGLHIADDDAEMLTPLDPSTLDADYPTTQLPFLARHNRVAAAMNAVGARALLSGLGGDQVFLSDPPEAFVLADLVIERRWRALSRAIPEWTRALGWPYWKTLWRGACWPLLPHGVQASFWRPEAHTPSLAEWIDPAFIRRMGLMERAMLILPDDLGFRLPTGAIHYGLLRQTVRQHVLGLCTTEGVVDVRYPFLDRRIIEFALATPVDQKVRPSETRSIVRRALKDVVPDAIRLRQSKSGPAEAFLRALNQQWSWVGTLLADPLICAHGLAKREPIIAAFHRARHGHIAGTAQLLRLLSLEIWLRSLETQGSSRLPSVAA